MRGSFYGTPGRRRRSIDFLPLRPTFMNREAIPEPRMRRRGSIEAVITHAFHTARLRKEEAHNHDDPSLPDVTVSVSSPSSSSSSSTMRIARRNSLEAIKTLVSDRAQTMNEKDDSESSSSLEDSILSLGQASHSRQSSSSTGLSYSELLERCTSPRESKWMIDQQSRRSSLGGSCKPMIETCRAAQQTMKPSSLSSNNPRMIRRSSLDLNLMKHVSVSKSVASTKRETKEYKIARSVPVRTSPESKHGATQQLVSFEIPRGRRRNKSVQTLSDMDKSQIHRLCHRRNSIQGNTMILPELSMSRYTSYRRSSLDYSRLQPEITPPSTLGLYELKRQCEDHDDDSDESYEDYNFDDDELSEITCSPLQGSSSSASSSSSSSKYLSDENRRWKSELKNSASQKSLATMPIRSKSPLRDMR